MSRNTEIVRNAYDAFERGDVEAVLGAMAPDIEWNEAENFPYADRNPYRGPDEIVDGVFVRLATEWDEWVLDVEEILDAGDTVVVLGRYRGRHAGTGEAIDAQFVHVWRLADGKIRRFQQYTDTAQAQRVVGQTAAT